MAFEEVKASESKMFQVYGVIKDYPEGISNREIAAVLGWPINCVTGRTRELVKFGLVEANISRKDKISGRKVLAWNVVKNEEIPKLRIKPLSTNSSIGNRCPQEMKVFTEKPFIYEQPPIISDGTFRNNKNIPLLK